jgi:thiamine-monophosphate kinase
MRTQFQFIEELRKLAFRQNPRRIIGDDCALISPLPRHEFVITADMLLEGVDFSVKWANATDIGHKALAVSLSDIAAAGGSPRFAMLCLGVPVRLWKTDFLDRFYDGWFTVANRYGVHLVGGDVSRSPDNLVIDSIAIGEVSKGHSIRRTGAKPGDLIFVSGTLGGAAAGLELLQKRRAGRDAKTHRGYKNLFERQLRPEPRVELGRHLGAQQLATSMIDLSDGLSSDLAHICRESGVGAKIDLEKIPLDPALENAFVRNQFRFSHEPLDFALNGGEDFELLFTVSPRNLKKLMSEVSEPITQIGVITRKRRKIETEFEGRKGILEPRGFQHF